MNNLNDSIENQLTFNAGKNLFRKEAIPLLKFSSETMAAFEYIEAIDASTETILIDFLTNRVLQEFCNMNQFYSFNKQNQNNLRDIYIDLFSNIKNHEKSIKITEKKHYTNLKNWLLKTNPFAEKMYCPKELFIEPVTCHEYSAELQLKILQIETAKMAGPVLDIGSGKQGNLVRLLRRSGIEAFGCDRFAEENPFITCQNWFEFEYGKNKWGTITSNLGFSNHFNHHHFRNDGQFIEYAKTYMNILNSLKIGGSFHYAPSLPFIERFLDKNKYKLEMQNIEKSIVKSVKIIRLQ